MGPLIYSPQRRAFMCGCAVPEETGIYAKDALSPLHGDAVQGVQVRMLLPPTADQA